MSLAPLATLDDLEERLGRALGDDAVRAAALLQDASAAARRAAGGQQISAGTSTVRLQARQGVVRLPQQPVTAVTTVKDVNGNGVVFQWQGGQQVYFRDIPVANASQAWLRRLAYVDVTYAHGYDENPDDVVAVVCQIAGRALGTPADQSGVTQETVGTYSYSVGAAAAAGPVGMLEAERRIMEGYRLLGAPVPML